MLCCSRSALKLAEAAMKPPTHGILPRAATTNRTYLDRLPPLSFAIKASCDVSDPSGCAIFVETRGTGSFSWFVMGSLALLESHSTYFCTSMLCGSLTTISGALRYSVIVPVMQTCLSRYFSSVVPNFSRFTPQIRAVKTWLGYGLSRLIKVGLPRVVAAQPVLANLPQTVAFSPTRG